MADRREQNAPARTLPRILVVDDHGDFRDILAIWLERHGFVVVTATDGEEGVAAACKYCPDAILMDVSMPGMDGIEATAQLKSSPVGPIPVIGFTSLPLETIESRAKAAGMVGVFAKHRLDDLLAVLRTITATTRAV